MNSKARSSWPYGFLLVFLTALALHASPGTDSKIDAGLMSRLADDDDAKAPFFVVFGERPDLTPAYRISNRQARAQFVARALQATANRSQAGVRGDRKSTRLNSSHVAISYAVFCLKKKTNTPGTTPTTARSI